jgi:hypothetical protein
VHASAVAAAAAAATVATTGAGAVALLSTAAAGTTTVSELSADVPVRGDAPTGESLFVEMGASLASLTDSAGTSTVATAAAASTAVHVGAVVLAAAAVVGGGVVEGRVFSVLLSAGARSSVASSHYCRLRVSDTQYSKSQAKM